MKVDKEKLDLMRARKQLRLSEIGVSKATLRRINARQELKPYTVGKIANALGCDVADILTEVS